MSGSGGGDGTSAPTREPLEKGRRLGEWVLEERLGAGGFGEVWRAHHNTLGDRVAAVKVPLVPFAGKQPERMKLEGTIQDRLVDPRIVRTLGLDPEHDPPYLVFEYVDGGSLRDLLAQGRLAPAEAQRIAREILLGLAAAHGAGIVHRDLKPENVLLTRAGEVKIGDFELAAAVTGQVQTLLASGSLRTGEGKDIVGTLRYMAPEQREPSGPVDARADLYAWGIILFELLTGELPCGAEVPSQVVPSLDPRLDQVFRRAYARRESRYASAREALADLDAIAATPASPAASNAPARSTAPRAGIVPRGIALAIDALPFVWLGAETESLRYALPLFALYDVASVALFGRTLGKALLGLRVVAEGGRPTPGRALDRTLARLLSIATAGVGFALAAVRTDKLALHDLLAGTWVEHE